MEDFAPYDHERSVTSPLYVEVFATTLGSLFRIALRTTYRAPLRGGLCHRSDSYEQTHVQERGYPRQNLYKKIAGRGLRRAKQPQGKGFRVLGDTRPRVPRQQVRHKTKLSLQDELFTWYGGVI